MAFYNWQKHTSAPRCILCVLSLHVCCCNIYTDYYQYLLPIYSILHDIHYFISSIGDSPSQTLFNIYWLQEPNGIKHLPTIYPTLQETINMIPI